MNDKRFPLTLIMAAVAAMANASTLPQRIVEYDTVIAAPSATTLANPALSPLRQPVSLSQVSAGFNKSKHMQSLSWEGTGDTDGFFSARTYLRTSKATITGHASYTNGKTTGVEGCEVTDASLLYPYFTADETGGDFRRETYSFGGSYASSFAGNWRWGAGLAYTAIQSYRKIDPRPKNTVGRLSFNAGLGYDFLGHTIAIGLDAMKYKQSNDIMFVSELGESKIYHSTGLGSHYARFAGMSKSAHYSGWQRGISLNFARSSENGAFASASFNRLTLDKTLTDLNNLPLNSIGENSYKIQGGWRTRHVSLSANLDASHRTGKDNIFGAPAGNVYPQIATYPTFLRHNTQVGILAAVRPVMGPSRRLDVWTNVAFSHTSDKYTGSLPARGSLLEYFSLAAGAEWVSAISSSFIIHAAADAALTAPVTGRLDGIDGNSDFFLDKIFLRDFTYASHHSSAAGISAGADWLLPRFCTLGLRVAYRHSSHTPSQSGNRIETAINIIF